MALRSSQRLAGLPHALTVGDSGSSDGSLEMLRSLASRFHIDVEHAQGRQHAEWLDQWCRESDESVAVFVDSDVRFLRHGWLAHLVGRLRATGSAIAAAEILPSYERVTVPRTGEVTRLAARPAPWLLAVDVAQITPLQVSFAEVTDYEADGGPLTYDVGARLFAAARTSGLLCSVMPLSFRTYYRHHGGLSWRSSGGPDGLRVPQYLSTRLRAERMIAAGRRGRGYATLFGIETAEVIRYGPAQTAKLLDPRRVSRAVKRRRRADSAIR